ncbi:MAG: hypothetical protein ACTHMU_07590, partial [Thermomicrobiales bacterium]
VAPTAVAVARGGGALRPLHAARSATPAIAASASNRRRLRWVATPSTALLSHTDTTPRRNYAAGRDVGCLAEAALHRCLGSAHRGRLRKVSYGCPSAA